MTVLGVVPARGGSKGIPRKNIVDLGGKPLLAHTAEAARAAESLDRVVLSTDDEEIADIGEEYGLEVPYLRPDELAEDEIPMEPVLEHALDNHVDETGEDPEAVVLLQPTSPFRQSRHVEEAVQRFWETSADAVVSVVEVPHEYNPVSIMILESQRLRPYEDTKVRRRQDKPKVYARNGPAVVVSKPGLIRAGDAYGASPAPYEMDRLSSVDIDDRHDLVVARALLDSGVLNQGSRSLGDDS